MIVGLAEGDIAVDLPVIERLRDARLARAIGEGDIFVPAADIRVATSARTR
jgi:hypothetical protein